MSDYILGEVRSILGRLKDEHIIDSYNDKTAEYIACTCEDYLNQYIDECLKKAFEDELSIEGEIINEYL